MKIPDTSRFEAFINTPNLWEGTFFGLTQFEFPKVDLSHFNASPLPDNLRLGHQIEQVFLQLVQHSNKYEVLLHNLPIKNEERTLGEIDFILKDLRSSQQVHVELTYKFYLLDTSIKDPILRWIGPNRKDRLFDKLEKIKNQHFKLSHSSIWYKTLYNNGLFYKNIENRTCFKAQLFMPYTNGNIEIHPLNPACIAGYWIGLKEFQNENFRHCQYYLPTKSEWPKHPYGNVEWMDHITALSQVKSALEREYSPMVWRKKSESEFEKFFVVWWG